MKRFLTLSLLLGCVLFTSCLGEPWDDDGHDHGPSWDCSYQEPDGIVDQGYNYTPEEIIEAVAGRWSGKYPGGRMPAFDVEIEVSFPEEIEVTYRYPVHDSPKAEITDEMLDRCAGMKISAEVNIWHEDVEGVSFDLASDWIAIRGDELGSSVTDQEATQAIWPQGKPVTEVQNTTDEPYQEDDDDEVTFVLSTDGVLWILERQPPYRQSGRKES